MCEHSVVVRSGAAVLSRCSRDRKTLGHVRLHGLTARSAHITSLYLFG